MFSAQRECDVNRLHSLSLVLYFLNYCWILLKLDSRLHDAVIVSVKNASTALSSANAVMVVSPVIGRSSEDIYFEPETLWGTRKNTIEFRLFMTLLNKDMSVDQLGFNK